MKTDEAEAKFRSADEFYRAGRYKAALSVLDELDRAFPNERHIMLPRARALHKLDRRDEAIAICDELVTKHNYAKAAKFKSRLLQETEPVQPTTFGAPAEEGFGIFSLSSLNIDLEQTPAESAFNKPRAAAPSRGIASSNAAKAAAAVLALGILAAGIYFWSQSGDMTEGEAADAATETAATGAAAAPAPTSTGAATPIDTTAPPELVRFQQSSSGEGISTNVSVEYAVWTNAGSYDNFKQKYAACEPAAARFESMLGTVDYRILGTGAGRCMIEVRFEKAAVADWSGKKMTCQCDPAMQFNDVVESFNPLAIAKGEVLCTGPLADAMRNMGGAR
jgi:hypothetical protein